jgi:hypothetical protein
LVLVGKPAPDAEGQKQLRLLSDPQASRWRITLEARQLVRHFLNPDLSPVGEVYKSLLVVPGAHARLSNISPEGTFLSTAQFRWGSKLVTHQQGHSAGRLLQSWRQVRQLHPELFDRVSVMSQPAANVDSVIFCWAQQELASEIPCSLWQRDCFSASFSEDAQQALFLNQSVSTTVAAKMTAALQLTDTDFSKEFKAKCRAEMDALRVEFDKEQAQLGLRTTFQPGALQIMQAVSAAQHEMEAKSSRNQWVLRGLRRNLMLSYRPDMRSGKLVPVTGNPEQTWAEDMPEGSSRLKTSWFENRLNWLTPSGQPLKPEWSLCELAKDVSDLIEWDYQHPEEAEEACLEVEAVSEELAEESQAALPSLAIDARTEESCSQKICRQDSQ